MVGYTAASQADEQSAIRSVRELGSVVDPILAEAGGRKIKSTGDGMLLEFESALKATQCAIELQRRLHERNADSGLKPIQVRVGIHLGDVEELGSDILGDAVNIAARIEPLADSGGVCISGEVFAQVRNKSATVWEALPPKELKGISSPVSVYRARLPWKDHPAASGGDPNKIAVLPFANFSPDASDEYFADGLTEELITDLAKIEGLRVIARTSVFGYKGTSKAMPQIGAELGVSTILEGSVRKSGDRVRITAQLIDVASQEHRWAETYDRKLEDVFAVQTEVALEVARSLQTRLGPVDESRLGGGGSAVAESYLAFLHGRTSMSHSFSERDLRDAQAQFERAIALDPKNARASAALSQATHLMGLFHRVKERKQLDTRARELADTAVRLEPNLPDGHSALGLLLYDACEWQAAEEEARLALRLSPSYSEVRVWYSMLLQEEGRGEDAHREMTQASELDPQSRFVGAVLLHLLLAIRRLDEARLALDRLRELDASKRLVHQYSAFYNLTRGDLEAAKREAQANIDAAPPTELGAPTALLAMILASAGSSKEARAKLAVAEAAPDARGAAETIAMAYGVLGDLDASFRVLQQKMAVGGALALQSLRLDPIAEPIRRDPRFALILKAMRLSD
jgi:adenylate cyclase